MKQWLFAVMTCFILMWGQLATAASIPDGRQWHIQGKNGAVLLSLKEYSGASEGYVLDVFPENNGENFVINDEEISKLVSMILDEMALQGFNSRDIRTVVTSLVDTAYKGEIDKVVEEKIDWMKCRQKYACWEGARLAKNYAKERRFYSIFNEAVHKYGLAVVGVSFGEMTISVNEGRPSCSALVYIQLGKLN